MINDKIAFKEIRAQTDAETYMVVVLKIEKWQLLKFFSFFWDIVLGKRWNHFEILFSYFTKRVEILGVYAISKIILFLFLAPINGT